MEAFFVICRMILERKPNLWLLCIGLSLLALGIFLYFSRTSAGAAGGMDSYEHYLIARYSWNYPHLLLDQWGKPLYTIIASPFAQLGFQGVVVLNILLLIATSWVSLFAARALKMKNSWLAFVAVIASPIFIDNTISGLTEPLNALMLALVILLFAKEKEMSAALISGFLPYARSEGYVILAVIGLYLLLYKRNYRATALLFVGSLVFNCLGWWLDHSPNEAGDPFWVITHNPYLNFELSGRNICGRGPLLHYVKISNYIFGRALLIMIAIAAFLIPVNFLRKGKKSDRQIEQVFFFGWGIFCLYFVIHSVIWYLGMMGSCGLQRVMIVIIPSSAIMVVYVFNQFTRLVNDKRMLVNGIGLIILPAVILEPFNYGKDKYPLPISKEQVLFLELADWYQQQDFSDRTVYFFYPWLNVLLDIDPYDSERFIKLWSFDESWAPHGSILIWDGHFGPNECNIPLERLQTDERYRHIQSFIPEVPFKTLNDYPFEIHVYEWTGNP